jgi:8-oxo-dGTP diphosphatase
MHKTESNQTNGIELCVDLVVLSLRAEALQVLLIPYSFSHSSGMWQLPETQVPQALSLDDAALLLLKQTTSASDVFIEQLYTYGDPKRSPRRRSVSCAYLALLPADSFPSTVLSEAKCYRWFPAESHPSLALDHLDILTYALRRLRYKLEYTAVGFQMLPSEFTLTELQSVYETILNERLDKRNFRRRIMTANVIEPAGCVRTGEGRPAQLYRYREDAVAEVKARRLFP